MRRTLVVLALCAAAAAAGASARTGGTGSFTDAAGDARGAADVAALDVRDDLDRQTVEITLIVALSSVDPSLEPTVNVHLDTDRDSVPGGRFDPEYTLMYGVRPDGSGCFQVLRRAGGDAQPLAPSPTLSFSRSGDALTWRIGKADVGDPDGLNIRAVSFTSSGDTLLGEDWAPDSGYWSYDLWKPEPVLVDPVIQAPTTAPAKPVAGKRFTVVFPVVRSDDGEPLTDGTLACDASIGGKLIPHTERLADGEARVSFTIPRAAKGKLLRVSVTVRAGTQSDVSAVTFRIR